jgi:hypothetical protein
MLISVATLFSQPRRRSLLSGIPGGGGGTVILPLPSYDAAPATPIDATAATITAARRATRLQTLSASAATITAARRTTRFQTLSASAATITAARRTERQQTLKSTAMTITVVRKRAA